MRLIKYKVYSYKYKYKAYSGTCGIYFEYLSIEYSLNFSLVHLYAFN
jgi:hypothetical protein